MRYILTAVCSLAALSCLGGRPVEPHPYELNFYRFESVRRGIAEYVDSAGRLPTDIGQLCSSTAWGDCPWINREHPYEDAWGQKILYSPLGESYQLTSLGSDGVLGSMDDVVFRPAEERALADAVAGCYSLTPLALGTDTIRSLVLDREGGSIGHFGASPTGGHYSEPYWMPLGTDSVLVRWLEVHSSIQLRLAVMNDTLVGTTAIGTGGGSWWGRSEEPMPVVAIRNPCDE